MDLSSVREILLSLPLTQAAFTVFLAACAVGGACTLLCIGIRAAPEVLKDFREWRALRNGTIGESAAWSDARASVHRGRD
jgi:hypothetical protein